MKGQYFDNPWSDHEADKKVAFFTIYDVPWQKKDECKYVRVSLCGVQCKIFTLGELAFLASSCLCDYVCVRMKFRQDPSCDNV